ncbi:hypothetical protein CHY08_02320 [Rhizobium leguminosarum bv. viciae]|uniref:hypothetical protein n=1 Tax=Rhizobium leguminosarum TaxID=384 RepID=UPI000B8C926A|nr:hypothetical protein [Rhizobium leguminosarum]ASR06052.1 hypothetical protein CHY08_02320 [Rhizobium leguminosarum bv. viciae]
MVSSNVLGCVAIVSIYCLIPQQRLSQETAHPVKVTYAVVMEGKEPFSAEVSCLPEDTCSLAKHDDLGIDLAITVFPGSEAHGELGIYCSPNPCSFQNLRSRIEFFGRRATVDILSGEADSGVTTLLVVRRRPRIGEVLISY